MTISREEEIKNSQVLLLLQSNSELKTLQKNIKKLVILFMIIPEVNYFLKL
ncbi:MAG: hypothetical protein ACRYE8_03725 [Janthinobacterium lividum]